MDVWTDGAYTAEDVLEPSESDLETCDVEFVRTTRIVAKQVAARGDYVKAETMLRTSLKAQEPVYGTENPEYLRAVFELCIVLGDLEKHEEARSLLLELVETRTRVLGSEHPQTINAMSGLADVYRILGQYDEAEALYEGTLLCADDVFGFDDYKTLIMRHNFALLLDALGKYEDAEPVYRICIEGLEAQCHPHNRDLLVVKENFGKNQEKLGNDVIAERAWCDALNGMVDGLGISHPITMEMTETLAWFYESNKRFEKALPLFLQLYDVKAKAHGENDTSALQMQINVVRQHLHLGNDSEALAKARSLVMALNSVVQAIDEKYDSQPGEEIDRYTVTRDLLCAQQLLARCYHFEDRYEESEQLYLEILSTVRGLKSTESKLAYPLLPRALHSLGELYKDQRRYNEAEDSLNAALKEYAEDAQDDCEYQARLCRVSLGRALGYQGKNEEASLAFQAVMDFPKDSHHISKLQEADVMVRVAFHYEDVDGWDEAYKLMKLALEIREEKLGVGHKETLVPLQGLGLCADMLDRDEESMYWYERAIVGMQEVYGFHFRDLHQVVTHWSRVCYRLGKEDQIAPRIEEYREHGVYFRLVKGTNDSSEADNEEEKEEEQREAPSLRESDSGMMAKRAMDSKHLRSRL